MSGTGQKVLCRKAPVKAVLFFDLINQKTYRQIKCQRDTVFSERKCFLVKYHHTTLLAQGYGFRSSLKKRRSPRHNLRRSFGREKRDTSGINVGGHDSHHRLHEGSWRKNYP